MGVAVGRHTPFEGKHTPRLVAPFFNYAYTREATHVLQIEPGAARAYHILENIEWLCRSIREHLPRSGFDMDSTYVRVVIFPDDNIHAYIRHIDNTYHIQYDSNTDHWYFRYTENTNLRDW